MGTSKWPNAITILSRPELPHFSAQVPKDSTRDSGRMCEGQRFPLAICYFEFGPIAAEGVLAR
ncbi:MAG: hypothetical protein K2V38_17135, partial [Gemmataceae bacterium]|nr:hypothetical protein [Gemmataceae bacterium]